MPFLNHERDEINAKIVYYGPGLSGKTTNLEYIHKRMPAQAKGEMVSMKTRTDRTLFFDFLPLEIGDIDNYRTRLNLYTVPGQVYYNATRKLVLKGVDAAVFVADSTPGTMDDNVESLRNLEENLNEYGLSLDHIPWVIQYNKRDVANAMGLEQLHTRLNLLNVPAFEAVATEGRGVYETFEGIARLLGEDLRGKLSRGEVLTGEPEELAQTGGEEAFELDSAVDSALREMEGAAGSETTDVPVAPVAPEPHISEERRNSAVGKTDPVGNASPQVSDPAPASRQAVATAQQPAGNAGEQSKPRFDDSPATMDDEVGNTLELDEASEASDAVVDEPLGEFITDPMGAARKPSPPVAAPERIEKLEPLGGGSTLDDNELFETVPPTEPVAPVKSEKPEKPAPVEDPPPAPVAAPAPSKEAPAPRKTPAPVAAAPPEPDAAAPAEPEVISIPVVLTRSQLSNPKPIKLLLEVEVIDD